MTKSGRNDSKAESIEKWVCAVVKNDSLRDIPADATLHIWKLVELSFLLVVNVVVVMSANFLKTKTRRALDNPSLRIHNIENLDLAFDRLRLYTILIVLHFVSQMFSVLDSLVQLASVCYGTSIDMNNLIGHAVDYEKPPGFSGPMILQDLLFNLNFASMRSGAKLMDLTWNSGSSKFDEFRYNVRMQSLLSVLTGRLSMLDSYVSPILIMTSLKMTRMFFKSLFGKNKS